MDRRRKILVNNYEKLADELITKAVNPYGARVCPKVGLKDIINISKSGITDEEYSYALMAHVDFCVINSEHFAEFGLEIDEDYHLYDREAILKDKIKDRICDKLGFPLLRISSQSLERVKDLEILAWLASYYFGFSEISKSRRNVNNPEVQKQLFLSKDLFIYSPFAEAYESIKLIEMTSLFENCEHELPACVSHNSDTYFISWAGVPLRSPGVSIESKPFLYCKKAFRQFNSFAGIYAFHLSEGLAVVELERKIKDYIYGSYSPKSNETLETMIREVNKEYLKAENFRKKGK